jgi:poly(hydroxyalkanoate) depolymerase family esterase
VKELPVSLANNVDFLRRLPKLDRVNGLAELGRLRPDVESPLVEVRDFGPNPGALRMFAFVPETMQQRALVVVLHGCGQNAAGYDRGAGWSALAQHYGFALLIPEQQTVNNANGCFNWFSAEDVTRDRGEVASIRQMIARMVEDHGIDHRHIFVTGLSAGGAMTSAMLATYPEVFSAGAIIAGLPFGVANNVRDALTIMRATPVRTPHRLGDFVRGASDHKGKWPRLSVWHGSVDGVVAPANAREIVKQWLDVHHLPDVPMSEGVIDGYPRQVWWNADGDTLVESYAITNMGHGTPVGRAGDERHYGKPNGFMLDVGISSSHHIAEFFRLTHSTPVTRPARPASPSTKLIPAVSWMASPAPVKVEASRVAEPALAVAARVEVPPPPVPLRAKLQAPPPSPRKPTEAKPSVSMQRPHPILGRVYHAIARKLVAAGLRK